MQMAQVAQRRLIFRAHAARKIRIVQVLIARGLRHVLQHAEPILNRASTVLRHAPPLWQHVVLDVVALRLRHLPPNVGAVGKILPLRGG